MQACDTRSVLGPADGFKAEDKSPETEVATGPSGLLFRAAQIRMLVNIEGEMGRVVTLDSSRHAQEGLGRG